MSPLLRCPADWEYSNVLWMVWPHNQNEWQDSLPSIKKFYSELLEIILTDQNIYLIVRNEEEEKDAKSSIPGHLLKNLHIFQIPNNDIWIRDTCCFFVKRDQTFSALSFEFNSWGEKFPPWDFDNQISHKISKQLSLNNQSINMVLEGGSLEFNGNGLALTTEECLLNPNRNSQLTKQQIHKNLCETFGLKDLIWLKNGLLRDHTDGHIDNVARFLDEKRVLLCTTEPGNPNFENLKENLNNLKEIQKKYSLEIIELPLPEKPESETPPSPISYNNFIFISGGILIPQFKCESDQHR